MEEQFQKTVLPNGVRVVTERIGHLRSCAVGFWVDVGSRDEEEEASRGICHLIEHMSFKGTATRTARQIAEAIDAIGGQLNAFTAKEHTCYYARVLDRHLSEAIASLADMLRHSLFDEGELQKEKGVILEEIKMYEDAPDELVHDLFAEAVLAGHPVARGILGTAQTVSAITRDQILRFLQEHYVGSRLVVAAAGHLEHQQVVDQVARFFADLPAGKPRRLQGAGGAAATGYVQQRGVWRHKEGEQVHLCLGAPAIPVNHPDKYALFLLDTLLGGGASSRLFQELREERGLVYSTYSYHNAFQDVGLVAVYAGTGPENAEQVLELASQQLARVAEEGPGEAELARAKEQLKGSLMLGLESTTSRMSRLAKAELYGERLLTPDEVMARLDAVTRGDVIELARRLFGEPEQLTTAALGPVPEGLASQIGPSSEAGGQREAPAAQRLRELAGDPARELAGGEGGQGSGRPTGMQQLRRSRP